MPTFSFVYDLMDVSTVMGNLFNANWQILAMAVGIPMAFNYSHRIKSLFD